MRRFLYFIPFLWICCTDSSELENWYKGNLHTHTFWSDGDAPPEIAVAWYKARGYDFLALSDHNILSVGEKWIKALDEDLIGWSPSMTKVKLANVWGRFGKNRTILPGFIVLKSAVFYFTGTETYVRSNIISDQLQDNPFAEGDQETAWTQPVRIK